MCDLLRYERFFMSFASTWKLSNEQTRSRSFFRASDNRIACDCQCREKKTSRHFNSFDGFFLLVLLFVLKSRGSTFIEEKMIVARCEYQMRAFGDDCFESVVGEKRTKLCSFNGSHSIITSHEWIGEIACQTQIIIQLFLIVFIFTVISSRAVYFLTSLDTVKVDRSFSEWKKCPWTLSTVLPLWPLH